MNIFHSSSIILSKNKIWKKGIDNKQRIGESIVHESYTKCITTYYSSELGLGDMQGKTILCEQKLAGNPISFVRKVITDWFVYTYSSSNIDHWFNNNIIISDILF